MNAPRSLLERLRERIKAHGPITFRDWMHSALYDPEQGYYCRADGNPWGAKGDYRTSAERTILFAATFARYFAKLYEEIGSPETWTIVESGAGAADFAAGVLETIETQFPGLSSAITYIVDEQSENSRDLARRKLGRWDHVQVESLSQMSSIASGLIFANELLDAFAVHRVIQKDGRLREFYVNLNSSGEFEWIVGELSTNRLAEYFSVEGIRLVEEQAAEVNLVIEDWLEFAAAKLSQGFLVLVDYGAEAKELFDSAGRGEGTLRSFRNHQFVDEPLAHAGEADLTTTVDWTFVRNVATRLGFEVVTFERQDQFLLSAGILDELERRSSLLHDDAERMRLRTEAREMILPSGMAGSFQVLVLRKR